MALWLILVALSTTATVCESYYNFLDCYENKATWIYSRICCKSEQLPNGCECFDISFWSDFTNSLYHLPFCPVNLHVKFYSFDRGHKDQFVDIRDEDVMDTQFQVSRDTVFIIHGFSDKGTVPWAQKMKTALLEANDLNVIIVDWKEAAKMPNYMQAVANTRSVGAMIARLIFDLYTYKWASLESFHLVGHSLGAHVGGIAGKEIERLTGGKLGRITGLDPAGPAFERYSANVRLDKSDATFVDVIHTDAEPLMETGLGIRTTIGHVDFWPNGGAHQPGCPPEIIGLAEIVNFNDNLDIIKCSHDRCLDLFINSITVCQYDPQGPCTMGYHVSTECQGDFYPNTTAEEPFC